MFFTFKQTKLVLFVGWKCLFERLSFFFMNIFQGYDMGWFCINDEDYL
jgi:hypothetical protein